MVLAHPQVVNDRFLAGLCHFLHRHPLPVVAAEASPRVATPASPASPGLGRRTGAPPSCGSPARQREDSAAAGGFRIPPPHADRRRGASRPIPGQTEWVARLELDRSVWTRPASAVSFRERKQGSASVLATELPRSRSGAIPWPSTRDKDFNDLPLAARSTCLNHFPAKYRFTVAPVCSLRPPTPAPSHRSPARALQPPPSLPWQIPRLPAQTLALPHRSPADLLSYFHSPDNARIPAAASAPSPPIGNVATVNATSILNCVAGTAASPRRAAAGSRLDNCPKIARCPIDSGAPAGPFINSNGTILSVCFAIERHLARRRPPQRLLPRAVIRPRSSATRRNISPIITLPTSFFLTAFSPNCSISS